MVEPYVDNGELISEERWLAFLKPLEQLPVLSERKQELIQKLKESLESAVKKRLPSASLSRRRSAQGRSEVKIGLLFSGGIDSTLIAFILKNLGVDFTCFSVGFHDGAAKLPEDIVESERVAKRLGFKHEKILFNLEEVEEVFKKTAKILGKELTNVVNIGVGSVEVAGFERGKVLGITHFFGGLGSEEIFAGYDRHEKALVEGGNDALHKECLAGLRQMYQRDLRRDVAISKALGITAATPFLDEELIAFSLAIPPELKINHSETFTGKLGGDVNGEKRFKKLILRYAAEAMGLPHGIAFRPKRAAQYGSRMNNAITKLTKRAGLKFKEEYLQSYLQSL